MVTFSSSRSSMLNRLLIIVLCAFPIVGYAATQDLEIRADEIRFSKEMIVAGDRVRLYAKIFNVGTEDISGFVSFYQGSVPIGNSQVISSVAGGLPDEVFVDFMIPSSEFNIRAEIRGTDPVDQNESNNTAITRMFRPMVDDDRDGVENVQDNCPNIANINQADSDADTIGDLCDEDDDNDGLSDAVEAELGSNPFAKDSDGDGTVDSNDAFPTDPTKTTREMSKPSSTQAAPVASKPESIPSTQAESSTIPKKSKDQPSKITALLNNVVDQVNETLTLVDRNEAVDSFVLSTNAIFTYERKAWNVFAFRLIGPAREDHVYEWNLGDETKSSHANVEHRYKKAGTYQVALTIHAPTGEKATEFVEVIVPFFSLSNPTVLWIMIILGALLLACFVAPRIIANKQRRFFSNAMNQACPKDLDDAETDESQEPSIDDEQDDGRVCLSPRKKRIVVKEE